MKKKTLMSAILAASIMGTASVTFAAASDFQESAFSDVPLGHWAYDAIAKLADDGIIKGYGDTNFEGGKAITRYEMAQLVANAMENMENARAIDKLAIEKLQAEFDSELRGEIQELRKDVDSLKDRMGWYADARVRWFANKAMKSGNVDGENNDRWTATSHGTSQFEKRLRLGFWANPAENLSVDGRLKYEDNSWNRDDMGGYNHNADEWYDSGSYNNQNSVRLDKLSLDWNHADTKVSLGRTEVSLGQGLLWWENPVDGAYVKHQFGPKVSAMVGVGDISAEGWHDTNMNAQFAEVAVQTSPATKITLSNMHTLSNSQGMSKSTAVKGWLNSDYVSAWSEGGTESKLWNDDFKNAFGGEATTSASWDENAYRLNQFALGVNSQLSPKWNVIAEVVTNNVGQPGTYWSDSAKGNVSEDINKHGFWTRLTYGKQDWGKANTWQAYAEYFALGNASIDSKYWGHRLNIAGGNANFGNGNNTWGDGARGFGLGLSYMLAANTNLELTWYRLKPYNENQAGFSKFDDVGYAALSYSF